MFGYVNVFKSELKVCEYEQFRAYYCGLCKAIGKNSQVARLGLSYDMTFLSIILSSISEDNIINKHARCIAHPLNKRMYVTDDIATAYSADMSIILAYLKLKDDWHDEKSIKALFGMIGYYRGVRKIRNIYKREYDEMISWLDKLSELERNSCDDIDIVADCFANILRVLFTPDFITDDNLRRTLDWLGYNTGRWIYIIDAFNDIEKDCKNKSYNPFLSKYNNNIDDHKKELSTKLDLSLTYTLSSIASSYELLDIYKNKGILDNIIYLGLKHKQDLILTKGMTEINESL